MARHTPLPRFRLETDSITERPFSDVRAASASPNMSQIHGPRRPPPPLQLQTQRSQNRIRRSACSDLQSTAIPEERVYNDNRRRASLFVGRPPPQTIGISSMSSYDQEPAEDDYAKLCRLRCQSLYGSLANSSTQSSLPISPLALSGVSFSTVSDDEDEDDDNEDDEAEEDEEEEEQPQQQQSFQTTTINNFRHSLPDTSPTGLTIRNFLRRNKTTDYHHSHRLGLPTHSSQSLYSPTSSSSSLSTNNSPSPLSTFRNFLSLVKLPSSSSSAKSMNSTTTATTASSSSISTTPHHSSLTTLTSATVGSSATLDQSIVSSSSSTSSKKQRPTTTLDTQYHWYFEVGKPMQ